MNRLLYRISAGLPCRIISDGDRPYLERYYVASAFGWTFYLHRFVASDPDRGVHDHPWGRAYSLILSGWYYEERRLLAPMRKVCYFNRLTGDTFHRVILPPRIGVPYDFENPTCDECWTLFFHSRYVKSWGFLRPYQVGGGDAGKLYREHAPTAGELTGKDRWWHSAPAGAFMNRQVQA